MDAAVDAVLGDRLRYRHDGVWIGTGEPATVEGFVLIVGASMTGVDELDSSLGQRWRVKIAKALVDEPKRQDRIAHPKLGPGWHQPSGDGLDDQGRYWVFDVQKVSQL